MIGLGLALVAIGVADRSWLLVAPWLGLDFLIVGIATVCKRHDVYGKRPDGTLPIWSLVVFLPLLIYTSVVWHLMRLVSREAAQNTVTSRLVIGRRLLPKEVGDEFEIYVDLTAEFVEPAKIRRTAGYMCFPILDGSAPQPKALLEAVKNLRRGRTFIHCAQGHGRTGLFAAALLLASGQAQDCKEALAMLQRVRPRIQLSRAQRKCIEQMRLIPA